MVPIGCVACLSFQHRCRHVGQLIPMTVVNEQVSTDEIRHTRTVRETIMSDHSTARLKFDPREEIPELLRWRPILQGDTQQTGDDVVQPDQLGVQSGPFTRRKTSAGSASSWTLR